MGEKLCFLGLLALLHTVSGGFLHEPSAILLKPGGEPNPKSNFGFAMGSWNGNLIVGSPSSNFFGEVYKCPITSITNEKNISCNVVDLKAMESKYSLELNPHQNFYLGASIATTKDYFFTCAPLVTKQIQRDRSPTIRKDAMGSCFIYSNNGTVRQYKGPDDRFLQKIDNKADRFEGGTGWNILADESNGFLIIAKTSVVGDINYSPISNPWITPYSLVKQSAEKKLRDYWDIGFGLAAGTFFTPNEVIYAFSMQSKRMTGEIVFLTKFRDYLKLMYNSKSKKTYSIRNKVIGGMFGYTLAAGDLNLDELSELLVGAPAQSDDTAEVETGALHIYLGGDKDSIGDINRMRTIFGAVEKGRFGTTIATSDIDEDNIPEVFVSAPYEESGVLYVLSGYELNRDLIRSLGFKSMLVTDLRLTQRVTRSEGWLGFSIQPVPDIDGNGCQDIAIGAPEAASVLLYRCLKTVNVTVSSKLIGLQNVKELDTNFTVNVCLQIGYSEKSSNITGTLSVMNDIIGSGVVIENPNFKLDLSEKKENHCENITVQMKDHEQADYNFITEVQLENITSTLSSKDFDKSWVVLSHYSVTKQELLVVRRCSGDNCYPKLSMDLPWNKSEKYEVGSSKAETVSMVVKNDGYAAYGACVRVGLTGGARVVRTECRSRDGGYECPLPTPLRRAAQHTISMTLNLTELSTTDKKLMVTARLFENCKNADNFTSKVLEVEYLFNKAREDVHLEGVSHNLFVTDKEIEDKDIKIFKDNHEYLITNKGSVEWKNVKAVIAIENRSFISKVNTTERENCEVINGEHQHVITCNFVLPPRNFKKIIAWAELSKSGVGRYLNGGENINVTSQLKLFLESSTHSKIKQVVTDIKLNKDLSFGNSMFMIILVAALLAILLLILITYCLNKHGFFKRKQKKRLNVLRESVRRRSIRLASERSSRPSHKTPSTADDDHLKDIEVMEDSAFEEVPVGTKDDVELIESRAEVHNHEPKTSTSK